MVLSSDKSQKALINPVDRPEVTSQNIVSFSFAPASTRFGAPSQNELWNIGACRLRGRPHIPPSVRKASPKVR